MCDARVLLTYDYNREDLGGKVALSLAEPEHQTAYPVPMTGRTSRQTPQRHLLRRQREPPENPFGWKGEARGDMNSSAAGNREGNETFPEQLFAVVTQKLVGERK